MEDFCRTCGKTVNAEQSINIFSPLNRRLLHSVRIVASCWVENVAGFPIYMCVECQSLLKKINSFRKRCIKIEAFLNKRKDKLCSVSGNLPSTIDKAKIKDPLRIEESENFVTDDIKEEPTHSNEKSNADGHNQISEMYPKDQQDSVGVDDLPFDEVIEEERTDASFAPPHVETDSKGKINAPKHFRKSKRKYTMRVGRRTMYIQLTDDPQPKRIVDRDRQWSSAGPCICEHCGRQFKDVSNLNVHLLRHTGTKNYECKECNEKCYTLHLLRRHQLKHTEGPYECTFCGQQYSTKSTRVRHERESCKKGRGPESKTELIKRGERTFHCDVCDLWFLRAGNLTQHLNSSNHTANARHKNKKIQLKQKNVTMDDRS